METTYNREDLQAHLELIKPNGFSLQSYGNEFYYTKQETGRKIFIMPSYQEYFPHDVVFSSISVDILFNNVEQILHDVYENNTYVDFKHFLNESPTFSKGIYSVLNQNDKDKLKSTQVSDDTTFNIVKPILEQMINAALTFVNQNQTLQNFYDLGEAMNDDDQLNFYGHPASFRMAIIKKLLNIPYNSFLQNEIALYNQHNMTDVVSFANALKTHLDNL
jgi:hypothetical protein